MQYEFNFCEPIARKCQGKEVFAAEFLDVYQSPTDTCEILGMATHTSITQLDSKSPEKGVALTYTGGQICEGSENPALNGLPRKVIFNLECAADGNEDANFILDEPGET